MRLTELKNRIRSDRVSVGTWISIGHPDVTEMLAHQGFDWLLFDLEHAPLTVESLQRLLQPMNGSPAAALVRTPLDQPSLAGRVLDCGADGVVFPLVNDRSQALAAVDACKYPPLGSRGMGPRRAAGYGRMEAEYLRSANDRTVVAIQIETGDAVERIDQILSVPGIDVALLGLGDLSANLGCHLEFAAPRVVAAVETVLACVWTPPRPSRHGLRPTTRSPPAPTSSRDSDWSPWAATTCSCWTVHAALSTVCGRCSDRRGRFGGAPAQLRGRRLPAQRRVAAADLPGVRGERARRWR